MQSLQIHCRLSNLGSSIIENNDICWKSSRFTTSEQTVMRKCMFFFLVFFWITVHETRILRDTAQIAIFQDASSLKRFYSLNLRMFSITSSSVRASARVLSVWWTLIWQHDSSNRYHFRFVSWMRRSIYHAVTRCSYIPSNSHAQYPECRQWDWMSAIPVNVLT
jgi:hypothetical protein